MQDMFGAGSGALIIVSALIGVALYLWYLAALSQLFPKLGLPASQGWIPVLNEWKLLTQAGLPGWLVLCVFIPPLGIILLIARTIAMQVIGRRTAAPTWLTVVGFLLPPLWATLTVQRFRSQHDDCVPAAHSSPSADGTRVHTGTETALPTVRPAETQQAALTPPALPAGVPAPAATESTSDDDFLALLASGQPTRSTLNDSATPVSPLGATHQLHDTEAHALPPITADALAEALGERVSALGTGADAAAPAAEVNPFAGLETLGLTPRNAENGGGSHHADQLGGTIEREYERLALEAFLAPPAVELSDTAQHERFSWEAALQQPAPAAPVASEKPQEEHLFRQRQQLTQAIPIQSVPPAAPELVAPSTEQSPNLSAPVSPEQSSSGLTLPPLHPVSVLANQSESPIPVDSLTNPTALGANVPSIESALLGVYAGPDEETQLIPSPSAAAEPTELPGTDPSDVAEAPLPAGVTEFSWALVFENGVVVPLHPDNVIGRAPAPVASAVPVRVVDPTRTLSKTHARLTFVGRVWIIEDLGSTNGVRLVHPGGEETTLQPEEPARATQFLWLGTMRAELKQAHP